MAFIFGLLSACSFPLGALSSSVWKPRDRSLAFLLRVWRRILAALTIDLVAPAGAGTIVLAVGASIAGICGLEPTCQRTWRVSAQDVHHGYISPERQRFKHLVYDTTDRGL